MNNYKEYLMRVILSMQIAFAILSTISSCTSSRVPTGEEPIAITLNQKRINLEKGLSLKRANTNIQPYLNLEINDSTIVEKLAKTDNLQIMLARGSRPITSFQTNYDIPYRMGFSIDSLLEKAEVGDRLIFTTEEYLFYTLAITR